MNFESRILQSSFEFYELFSPIFKDDCPEQTENDSEDGKKMQATEMYVIDLLGDTKMLKAQCY